MIDGPGGADDIGVPEEEIESSPERRFEDIFDELTIKVEPEQQARLEAHIRNIIRLLKEEVSEEGYSERGKVIKTTYQELVDQIVEKKTGRDEIIIHRILALIMGARVDYEAGHKASAFSNLEDALMYADQMVTVIDDPRLKKIKSLAIELLNLFEEINGSYE